MTFIKNSDIIIIQGEGKSPHNDAGSPSWLRHEPHKLVTRGSESHSRNHQRTGVVKYPVSARVIDTSLSGLNGGI